MGVDVIPYPCNYIAGTGNIGVGELVPNAESMTKWNVYIKEMIGLAVNYVSGRG